MKYITRENRVDVYRGHEKVATIAKRKNPVHPELLAQASRCHSLEAFFYGVLKLPFCHETTTTLNALKRKEITGIFLCVVDVFSLADSGFAHGFGTKRATDLDNAISTFQP